MEKEASVPWFLLAPRRKSKTCLPCFPVLQQKCLQQNITSWYPDLFSSWFKCLVVEVVIFPVVFPPTFSCSVLYLFFILAWSKIGNTSLLIAALKPCDLIPTHGFTGFLNAICSQTGVSGFTCFPMPHLGNYAFHISFYSPKLIYSQCLPSWFQALPIQSSKKPRHHLRSLFSMQHPHQFIASSWTSLSLSPVHPCHNSGLFLLSAESLWIIPCVKTFLWSSPLCTCSMTFKKYPYSKIIIQHF